MRWRELLRDLVVSIVAGIIVTIGFGVVLHRVPWLAVIAVSFYIAWAVFTARVFRDVRRQQKADQAERSSDEKIRESIRIRPAPPEERPLQLLLVHGVPRLYLKLELWKTSPHATTTVDEIELGVPHVFSMRHTLDSRGPYELLETTLTIEAYRHLEKMLEAEHRLPFTGSAELRMGKRVVKLPLEFVAYRIELS